MAAPTTETRPCSTVASEQEPRRSLPAVVQVAAVFLLFVGLAAIGAISMVLGQGGVAVAHGAAPSSLPSAEPPLELTSPTSRTDGGGAGGTSPAITADGKVILNLAEVADLRRLPGVGPRRAEAIVQLRTRIKRFRRVTDLLRVRGIGIRGVRRIEPHVVLDPPAAADAGSEAGLDAGAPDR